MTDGYISPDRTHCALLTIDVQRDTTMKNDLANLANAFMGARRL